jgi:hypothetical protein
LGQRIGVLWEAVARVGPFEIKAQTTPLKSAVGLGGYRGHMKAQAMRHILLVDDHAAVRHELALVDFSLGDDDALRLVAELCARDIPVLVCSTHDEPGYVRRALDGRRPRLHHQA